MYTIGQDMEQFEETETRSATQIIEDTLKEDEEARKLYALFEKEIALKEYDRARKVAWWLFFQHGVDLFN